MLGVVSVQPGPVGNRFHPVTGSLHEQLVPGRDQTSLLQHRRSMPQPLRYADRCHHRLARCLEFLKRTGDRTRVKCHFEPPPRTGTVVQIILLLVRSAISDGEIRILFAFDPWRSAILLIAGDKAGQWQRWYREAIPRAEQLYES